MSPLAAPAKLLLLAVLLPTLWLARAYAQTPAPTPQGNARAGSGWDNEAWGFKEAPVTDRALPKVLLIGDSILAGYRREVAELLKGKANVDCLCTPISLNGLKGLEDQLKAAFQQGPYAVVHFNDMGLHGFQKGRIADNQYEPLLKSYVQVLKAGAPVATLIWASTTPFTVLKKPTVLDPANTVITTRNDIAACVMKELNIQTDDLYKLMSGNLALARGDQYHWTPQGQTMEARQVAAAIISTLDVHKVH